MRTLEWVYCKASEKEEYCHKKEIFTFVLNSLTVSGFPPFGNSSDERLLWYPIPIVGMALEALLPATI